MKPGINIHQRLCSDAAGASLSIAPPRYKTRSLENADMLGDSARRHMERLGKFDD